MRIHDGFLRVANQQTRWGPRSSSSNPSLRLNPPNGWVYTLSRSGGIIQQLRRMRPDALPSLSPGTFCAKGWHRTAEKIPEEIRRALQMAFQKCGVRDCRL